MTGAMTRRRFLSGSAGLTMGIGSLAGFCALLEACGGGGGGASGKEIKLGAVISLTGNNAGFGQGTGRGLQTAVQLVNQAGGIKSQGGSKLAVQTYDTQSKPDVAGTQATKAIQDGAVCLIGCNQSPAALIASQIAERNSVPFVTPSDFDPSLTGRGFKYTFQTDPFQTEHVRQMLAFCAEQGKKSGSPARKLGIICDNTVVGQSAQKSFEQMASAHGFQVAQSKSYAVSVNDFSSYIADMKSAGVELLLGFQTPSQSVLIVQAMKQQRFDPIAFGGILGGQVTAEYVNSLGADADYTLCSSAFNDDLKIPGLKKVLDAFKAQWHEDVDDVRAAGFAAVAVVWDALERAGSDDPKKLRDAIAATQLNAGQRNYVEVDGVKFDGKGYNTRATIDIKQIKSKAWHSVSPDRFASATPVWPRPKWA